jgi:signal transduction histidine kinase
MDAETLAHLFEPFYSTKGTRGTGLGLALIQSWMLDLGGEVKAESAVGTGTSFTLVFPACAAPAQQL